MEHSSTDDARRREPTVVACRVARRPIEPKRVLPRRLAWQLTADRSFERRRSYELFLELLRDVLARSTAGRRSTGACCGTTTTSSFELTDGGLSEGMRELNGGFSRRMQRALRARRARATSFRHAVRRASASTTDDVTSSRSAATSTSTRSAADQCEAPERVAVVRATAATIGLEHPRPFHDADELLRYSPIEPVEPATPLRASAGGIVQTDSPVARRTGRHAVRRD